MDATIAQSDDDTGASKLRAFVAIQDRQASLGIGSGELVHLTADTRTASGRLAEPRIVSEVVEPPGHRALGYETRRAQEAMRASVSLPERAVDEEVITHREDRPDSNDPRSSWSCSNPWGSRMAMTNACCRSILRS
jgi:hypothetical protein